MESDNIQQIIDLAIAYTREASELKDYQVPTRKAWNARKVSQNILNNGKGYLETSYKEAQIIANYEKIDIEEYDPNETSFFSIWALVPEYDHHKKAKIILRRVGTSDGEILLTPEKRCDRPFKISDREAQIIELRKRKALITKIRNYEAQIKDARRMLAEQINSDNKSGMKTSALRLKNIFQDAMDDMADFLNQPAVPF